MTARLFVSLFCHAGSGPMAAKHLFLSKVFSKKPKSIIQNGDFEKTSATLFNFSLDLSFLKMRHAHIGRGRATENMLTIVTGGHACAAGPVLRIGIPVLHASPE